MQFSNAPVHQSHFDSIFNFVCPSGHEKTASKKGGIVYDIFFEVTTDHIKVDMEFVDRDGEDQDETMYLNHDKFRSWVEKENLLTVSFESHRQEGGDLVSEDHEYQIGYAEFCEEHLTTQHIADYLTATKQTGHEFQL